MTSYAGTWTADTREHVTRIVGCEYRAGRCVAHQRPNDQWRPGCPYVDSLMRDARGMTR